MLSDLEKQLKILKPAVK